MKSYLEMFCQQILCMRANRTIHTKPNTLLILMGKYVLSNGRMIYYHNTGRFNLTQYGYCSSLECPLLVQLKACI